MEIGKGLSLNYNKENGNVELAYSLKSLVIPALESLKAKVDAGEIDLIKGTDLDKVAIDTVIALVEANL